MTGARRPLALVPPPVADAPATPASIEAVATPPEGAAIDRPSLGPNPGPISLADLVAVAGRKAMWVHLDRMLAREPAIQDPDQPDELRRYRVATRRMRAALRMFRFAYREREVRPLRRGLAGLASAVGAIRDLDNRIADLNRWAVERGGDTPTAVSGLSDAWASDRARAVRRLGERLASRRHRRLVTALAAFVQATTPPNRHDRRVRRTAPTIDNRLASLLWAAYEEVRAFAPVLDEADLPTIHRLRIATKRLRDDLEFLADVLPPERAWLVERLVALQDHLGTLNDATVAAAAVRTFLGLPHGRLGASERAEITAYLTDREHAVSELRRSLDGPWQPVASIGFARRLGRLVVVGPAAS